MGRLYLIDGHQVTVSWVHRFQRQGHSVYTIHIEGKPAAGSVEKTVNGSFLALDSQRQPVGTFSGLRAAVEHVVREELH